MTTEPIPVVAVRFFAAAREAAGTGADRFPGRTVGDVTAAAVAKYGERFATVLSHSRVWLNGLPAGAADPVGPGDEVAVLPPVSGGCR